MLPAQHGLATRFAFEVSKCNVPCPHARAFQLRRLIALASIYAGSGEGHGKLLQHSFTVGIAARIPVDTVILDLTPHRMGT